MTTSDEAVDSSRSEDEIQHRVQECVDRILGCHNWLREIMSDFSVDDLAYWISYLYDNLVDGSVGNVPLEVSSNGKSLLQNGHGQELIELLVEWDNSWKPFNLEPLDESDLEELAVALIWGSVLISEYRGRIAGPETHS